MNKLIAICGKGGVGKTTVAGLMVRRLIERGCKPVLAMDADPNNCLDALLGVEVSKTVGAVREKAREMAGQGIKSGVSKQEWLQMKIEESLVEADDFDLIAMGRAEGPGCYCYANNVLKQTLGALHEHYPYVVLDNEAGLENLSRRLVQQVDLMVMVGDDTANGLKTIERLYTLAAEMEIRWNHLALAINRMRNDKPSAHALALQEKLGAAHLAALPYSDEIMDMAEQGNSVFSLAPDCAVFKPFDQLLDACLDQAASVAV